MVRDSLAIVWAVALARAGAAVCVVALGVFLPAGTARADSTPPRPPGGLAVADVPDPEPPPGGGAPAAATGGAGAAAAATGGAPAAATGGAGAAAAATGGATAAATGGAGAPAETDVDADADADERAPADADAALKRVLASGCRDGLADVYALTGSASAPWAETVLRLCGEVLRTARRSRVRVVPAREIAPPPPRDATRDGRGQLVFWSGLYGGWLGVAADLMLDIDSGRGAILPPMLGVGAGLAVSLIMSANVRVTSGEAWTIITGLEYGSVGGALWATGLGAGKKGIVGTSVATSVAATAVALAVADAKSPSAGQIELCRSGLLWGSVAGLLGVLAFAPESGPSGRAIALGTAIAMDAGFLAGLGAARRFEVSRSRALIIDAGALTGTILGFGTVWLAAGGTGGHGQLLAGGGLVGLAGGVVIAALATRNLDATGEPVAGAAASFPALVARDGGGHWRAGTPAPLPVLDPHGVRLVGAALSAVGGLF